MTDYPQPLQVPEIRALLAEIEYMPGWTFEVDSGPWEGIQLIIRANLPDSYNPGERIQIGIRSYMPPLLSIEQFDRWMVWRLERIASHEVREFYRRDGKPVFDPHTEEVR